MNDTISFNSPFLQMLEDKQSRITVYSVQSFDAQFVHNFRPDHGQTVDKPWNDRSRAWNGISRAWAEVPDFSINLIFYATANFWIPPPKKGQQFGLQFGYS